MVILFQWHCDSGCVCGKVCSYFKSFIKLMEYGPEREFGWLDYANVLELA